MSSTISSCSYDPDNVTGFERIDPLSDVQHGQYDISYLVHDIVTKDFGYTGTNPYLLTLQDGYMVLEIWNGPTKMTKREYAQLQFNQGAWERTDAASQNVTVLKEKDPTTARLRHTMARVANAYGRTQPLLPTTGMRPVAQVEAEKTAATGTVVNNYITCGHSDCSSLIQTLAHQMSELNRRLEALETILSASQPIRPGEVSPNVSKLEDTIRQLHERMEALQRDVDQLREQNATLKGLKAPLDKLAEDVPQALRDIRFEIEQLRRALDKLPEKSSATQERLVEEMRAGLRRIESELESLKAANRDLKAEKADLEEENAALKLQVRKIEDLREKDRAQQEQLRKLQAALEKVEAEKAADKERLEAKIAELKRELEGYEALKAQMGPLQEDLRKAQQAQRETLAANKRLEELLRAAQASDEKFQLLAAQAQAELEGIRRFAGRQLEELTGAQLKIAALEKEVEENKKLIAEQQEKLKKAEEINADKEGRILALRGLNKDLQAKNVALADEVARLKKLLEASAATDRQAKQRIAELERSLQERDQALAKEKETTQAALHAKEKTEKALKDLQWQLAEQKERTREAEKSRAYYEDLLKGMGKKYGDAVRELSDLKRDYGELSRISSDLEGEQAERIRALEAQLLALQSKLADAEKAVQTKVDPVEIVQLRQQIEEHKARELSDRLLQAQLDEARRQLDGAEKARRAAEGKNVLIERQNKQLLLEIDELRAEIAQLRQLLKLDEKKVLPASTLKPLSEDLRRADPLPSVVTTSKHPATATFHTDDIEETLGNIRGVVEALGEEVPAKIVGTIVINLSFLDGKLPAEGKKQVYIQDRFESEIEARELQRLEKSLTVHFEELRPAVYKETNVRTIAGNLTTALRDPVIGILRQPEKFKTLDACFSDRMMIVKGLQQAKLKLVPIVTAYRALDDKDPSRQANFALAERLIGQIDAVLGTIETKLRGTKFRIKA